MNSRRRISEPKLRRQHCIGSEEYFDRAQTGPSKPLPQCTANVADGSKPEVTALQQQWPVHPQIADIPEVKSPAPPTGLGSYAAPTLTPAKGLPAVPNMRPMVAGWTA
jgi:hypothetical protein